MAWSARLFSRSRRAALVAFLLTSVLCALTFYLGVRTTIGQWAEQIVLESAEFNTNVGFPLSFVSPLNLVLSIVVVAVLAFAVWGLRRALLIVCASATAVLVSQLLKRELLERPLLWDSLQQHNSFPSGHVTVFAVIGFALLFAVPAALRGFMSVLVGVGLGWIGRLVLIHGWHRPSDVIGALMLSAAAYALWAYVFEIQRGSAGLGTRVVSFIMKLAGSAALLIAAAFLIYARVTSEHAAVMVAAEAFVYAAALWVASRISRLARG